MFACCSPLSNDKRKPKRYTCNLFMHGLPTRYLILLFFFWIHDDQIQARASAQLEAQRGAMQQREQSLNASMDQMRAELTRTR